MAIEAKRLSSEIQFSYLTLPEKARITVHLSYHNNNQDIDNLYGLIRQHDVIIPEITGWHSSQLRLLEDISQGKANVLDSARRQLRSNGDRHGHMSNIFENLYRTKKEVLLVDVPSNSGIFKELYLHTQVPVSALMNQDFDKTLRLISSYDKKEAELNHRRDEYIANNICTSLAHLIDKNPKLKEKDHVKALILLGSTHGQVYRLLHSNPLNEDKIRLIFNPRKQVFNFENELERRHMRGLTITRELVARVFAELILRESIIPDVRLASISRKTNDQVVILRNVIYKLSLDEIKDLHKEVMNNGINEALKSTGIGAKINDILLDIERQERLF